MSDTRRRRSIMRCAALFLMPYALGAATAQGFEFTGKVVDRDSGRAISGALIEAQDLGLQSLPFSATTTNRDGRFALPVPAREKVLLIVRSVSGAYAVFHGVLDAEAAQNFENVALSKLSPDELAWLQRINVDRAARRLAPVVMDEAALLAAREHVTDMAANGYLQHTDRIGREPWQRYSTLLGVGGDYENIGAGEDAVWSDVEAEFIAEGQPLSGVNTHYTNLFNPRIVWVGLAIARGGRPFDANSGSANYFDQELIEYPY